MVYYGWPQIHGARDNEKQMLRIKLSSDFAHVDRSNDFKQIQPELDLLSLLVRIEGSTGIRNRSVSDEK